MKLKLNFGALKKIKDNIKREFGDKVDGDEFVRGVVRTAGVRLHSKVEKRTPVDTGQLRQNWEIGDVVKRGFNYTITIENPVEYASYVEYGHKQEVGRYVPAIGKKLVEPWVEGQHFVEKSNMEMEEELPDLIEEKMIKKLLEIFP